MIRIANAPCSWGVIENVEGETGGYRRVLDEMAETGYAGTELGDWGFMPTDPAALRAELDGRGPRAARLVLHAVAPGPRPPRAGRGRRRPDRASCSPRWAGPTTMIVLGNDPYGDPVRGQNAGRITPEMGLDDAGWEVYAAAANRLARRVRDEAGIRTVVHQHLGTLIETGAEVRRLMAMTDPDLLGHLPRHRALDLRDRREPGGRRPRVRRPDLARALQGRGSGGHGASRAAEGWHGLESTGHGVFCELGKGSVDFPGVLAALEEIGLRRLDRRGAGHPARHGQPEGERPAQPGVPAVHRALTARRRTGGATARGTPWATGSGSGSRGPAGGPTRCTCRRSRTTRWPTSAASPAAPARSTRASSPRSGGSRPPTTRSTSMLDAEPLDALLVLTPNKAHYATAMAGIERGLHVLCEKPLGMTAREARLLAEAADRAGVTTMVPFTYRFMPANRYLKAAPRRGLARAAVPPQHALLHGLRAVGRVRLALRRRRGGLRDLGRPRVALGVPRPLVLRRDPRR